MRALEQDRPCAAYGLTSYRYPSNYGWIMIGATSDQDALSEARRSTSAQVVLERLQVWDGFAYVNAVTGEA